MSLAYFYGSQVGGAVHAESDLDLALVTSDAHDIDYGEIYSHLCISAVHSKLSL
ncbi:hypothetical protein HYU92_02415 [Candidatus Curtissbacteria bacterium]|nr:hypothetical protein [Candidatus Curtissbacteria bacterium]